MNQFLPSRYAENIKRLALGLEPLDAAQHLRIGQPLEVTFDTAPLKLPRPPIDRHRTNLYVLLYAPKLTSPVDLRFVDPSRRFVPRRLRIPILAAGAADAQPVGRRVRRPALYPGAAYDASSGATGVRGRVLRGGKIVRWCRAEARLPGHGAVVGLAHGDDRGEFLLLIDPSASPAGDLDPLLAVEVTVFALPAPPAPATPDLPAIDPLWDLPLEPVPAPGAPDTVSPGDTPPAGYTATASQNLDLSFGRIRSDVTFNLP